MRLEKICIITPTLEAGGTERVIAILSNYFQHKKHIQVHLILMVGGEIFFPVDKKIIIHRPSFNYKQSPKWFYLWKILQFTRNSLKKIKPNALLCFGGKYNSFVLIAALGLGIKTYISDRSRPGISYGKLLDFLNPYVYRLATGIISQTEGAKKWIYRQTRHKNIMVIGNPIPVSVLSNSDLKKENIILNVGRFIPSKQQELLIDLFIEINPKNGWVLHFLGDGENLQACIQKVKKLGFERKIKFYGNQKNVAPYFVKSKIFAFTSISEGFPNALGEAMAAGCACISFDCLAGPADLINSEEDGILIPLENVDQYKERLIELIENESLQTYLSKNAVNKIQYYEENSISQKFLNFIECH